MLQWRARSLLSCVRRILASTASSSFGQLSISLLTEYLTDLPRVLQKNKVRRYDMLFLLMETRLRHAPLLCVVVACACYDRLAGIRTRID